MKKPRHLELRRNDPVHRGASSGLVILPLTDPAEPDRIHRVKLTDEQARELMAQLAAALGLTDYDPVKAHTERLARLAGVEIPEWMAQAAKLGVTHFTDDQLARAGDEVDAVRQAGQERIGSIMNASRPHPERWAPKPVTAEPDQVELVMNNSAGTFTPRPHQPAQLKTDEECQHGSRLESEQPSAFVGGAPVRTYVDGCQTFGPYPNDTIVCQHGSPLESEQTSAIVGAAPVRTFADGCLSFGPEHEPVRATVSTGFCRCGKALTRCEQWKPAGESGGVPDNHSEGV